MTEIAGVQRFCTQIMPRFALSRGFAAVAWTRGSSWWISRLNVSRLSQTVEGLELVFPPKVLRMDNGPELVSQALQRFCENKTGLVYIPPGCPCGSTAISNRSTTGCVRSASTATTGTPCSRPACSSAISSTNIITDTAIRRWLPYAGRVRFGLQKHPYPRGLRDQLNPNQTNPTLRSSLSNGDSPWRCRLTLRAIPACVPSPSSGLLGPVQASSSPTSQQTSLPIRVDFSARLTAAGPITWARRRSFAHLRPRSPSVGEYDGFEYAGVPVRANMAPGQLD
jgi:hypothetical protein